MRRHSHGPIAGKVAGLLIVSLAVAGCGNTSLSSGPKASGVLSSEPAASVGSADRGEANPFLDQSHQVLATREVIANPTLEEVMRPASALTEMSVGRTDAPVTLIKYASMTCPFCRQFQMEAFPELKRQYIDTGKLRFILREFPIGFQSGLATVALRCVPEAKYFQAYDRLMRTQNTWASQEVRPEPIVKALGDLGLTRDKLETCRTDKSLVSALNAVKERGRNLGIVGTPNFFVNGRLVRSTLTLNDVKDLIDPIIAGSSTTTAQTTPQKT